MRTWRGTDKMLRRITNLPPCGTRKTRSLNKSSGGRSRLEVSLKFSQTSLCLVICCSPSHVILKVSVTLRPSHSMERPIWRWKQSIKNWFRSSQCLFKITKKTLALTVKLNVKLLTTVSTSSKALWKWTPDQIFHLVQRTCSSGDLRLEIPKLPLESSSLQVTKPKSCKMQPKQLLNGLTLSAKQTKLSSLYYSSN